MPDNQLVRKAKYRYENEGLSEFFRSIVRFVHRRTVRPYLPGERIEIRGVTIGGEERKAKPFDGLLGIGWPQDHKEPNCALVEEHVSEGDAVVVIGGGYGITTVVAARQAAPSGHVQVYEGASEQIGPLRETLELNGVRDVTEVEHAIVGEAVDLIGTPQGAEVIPASELNRCDVLEMDCEGAEADIIEDLTERPDAIVVETHPGKGTPTPEVERALGEHGYDISDKRVDRDDGHVLVAT